MIGGVRAKILSSVPPVTVKILILKPSSLGDVIQALPVLRLLKRHLPAQRNFLVD